MDIIQKIERNFLLKDLFPEGLTEPVRLGKLELRIDDRIGLSIHTTQKPVKQPPKWGEWGKSYNTIVIELLGQFIKKIQVNDWSNISYCTIDCTYEAPIIHLNFIDTKGSVILELQSLIFQNCTVYIDSED